MAKLSHSVIQLVPGPITRPCHVLVNTFPPALASLLQEACSPVYLEGKIADLNRRSTRQAWGLCWGNNGFTGGVAVVARRSKDGGKTWSDLQVVITGCSVVATGKIILQTSPLIQGYILIPTKDYITPYKYSSESSY